MLTDLNNFYQINISGKNIKDTIIDNVSINEIKKCISNNDSILNLQIITKLEKDLIKLYSLSIIFWKSHDNDFNLVIS